MNEKLNNSLYKLLEKSLKNQKYTQYKKGDLAEGIVEKVGDGYLVVKIGKTYDAVVPNGELEKEFKSAVKVGDKIKVSVLKSEDEYGNMIVSQKRTTTGQRWDMLLEAYKDEKAVMVTVVEANNGGVLVNVDGVTGFIPTSQLNPNTVYKVDAENASKDDLQKELSRKLSQLVGSKLSVKIVEIDREKNRVIFSEKLALSDQSVEQRSQTIKNAKIGDVMEAIITAVTPYGIFVNAEGLDGLVHVSEISWDKVENTSDFAGVGDKIRVKLIDIDDEGKRVAYSIKQLSDDPWNEVAVDYKVGGKVKGTITEIEDYGVIVKVGNGVTGLIHKSELTDEKMGDPKDHFKTGDEVEAIILTISPSERKMGLSIKRLNASKPKRSTVKPKITKSTKAVQTLDIAGALEKAGVSFEDSTDKEKEVEVIEKPKKARKTKTKEAEEAKTKE